MIFINDVCENLRKKKYLVKNFLLRPILSLRILVYMLYNSVSQSFPATNRFQIEKMLADLFEQTKIK